MFYIIDTGRDQRNNSTQLNLQLIFELRLVVATSFLSILKQETKKILMTTLIDQDKIQIEFYKLRVAQIS